MEKELRRLNRRELVDIIYQMKKNEELMKEEITSLQNALQDKRIRMSAAGSISEAAADITQVFSAAQSTADLYLSEIACMKAEAEKECKEMVNESRKEVIEILTKGEKDLANLRKIYKAEYKKYQYLKTKIDSIRTIKKT